MPGQGPVPGVAKRYADFVLVLGDYFECSHELLFPRSLFRRNVLRHTDHEGEGKLLRNHSLLHCTS
jgi:hypothetical protein